MVIRAHAHYEIVHHPIVDLSATLGEGFSELLELALDEDRRRFISAGGWRVRCGYGF
jgi:hypothetical protein